jgi:trk system potassium uptake protein TrkH
MFMAGRAAESLAFAVRGRVIVRFHGELCLTLTGVALVPALFAAIDGDGWFALNSAAVSAALAAIWWFSTRRPAPGQLRPNEALVVVALGYLLTALLMSWPLSCEGVSLLDAFFQSVSAITTTGLSTAGSVAARSESFLFASAWMQWYGGLVVVVLAVLLMEPGVSARHLAGTEQDQSDLEAGTRERARWALRIYLALTAAGWLLLVALGGGALDSLLHVLSGVSTGGFSTHDDSLAGFGGRLAQLGLMAASLAGAIPFSSYRALMSRPAAGSSRLRAFLDAETIALLVFCLALALWLAATMSLLGDMPWRESLWSAPLLAISAQSTAGFTPIDVGGLEASAKLALILSMFVGGGVGSTAGGIKVMRLLLMARIAQLFVLRPALPRHAVVTTRLNGRGLEQDDLRQVLGIVTLFIAVILCSWAAFLLYEYDALDALFEVVSATGTVGLTTGLSGPRLEPALKAVLCLDMWMGRLEILAVLVTLNPRTWFGRRAWQQ